MGGGRTYTTSAKVKPRPCKKVYFKYYSDKTNKASKCNSKVQRSAVIGWTRSSVTGASAQYAPKIHYQVDVSRRLMSQKSYKRMASLSGNTSYNSYMFPLTKYKANYRIVVRPYVLKKSNGKLTRSYGKGTVKYLTKMGSPKTDFTYVNVSYISRS